ncbi:serine proteinase stubble [Ixodes scapularis]
MRENKTKLYLLPHTTEGAVRTIQPKPCMNKASGQEGTCMFAWDCFSAGGTHLTYCTDSFYTGSCCKLPPGVVVHQHEMPSDPTNSIDSIADDSDEDYNKKTKKPSLSTAKPTVPMRKTTPQAVHLTKPTVSPQETSQSTPSFGGLSTFTPGLITWRPHETTLVTDSKTPLVTSPGPVEHGTTSSTKASKPSTTRIPIVASTFLHPEEPPRTTGSTLEATEKTQPTTKGPPKIDVETTTQPISMIPSSESAKPHPSSALTPTPGQEPHSTQTTPMPATSSVQSHTWIVNEHETTMPIPTSVPSEQSWVVVDEADASGQQTTIVQVPSTQKMPSTKPPHTSPMSDWSTVTEMMTSISWVDMSELSTSHISPPKTSETSLPPTKTTPHKTTEKTTVASHAPIYTSTTHKPTTGQVAPSEFLNTVDVNTPTRMQVSTKVTTPLTTKGATTQPTTTQQYVTSTVSTTSSRPASASSQTSVPTSSSKVTTGRSTTLPTTTTARTTEKPSTLPSYTTPKSTTVTKAKPTQTTKTSPSRRPSPTTAGTTTPATPATLTADRDIRKVCGRPKVVPRARIVGGDQTKFAQWPWMISLRQFKRNTFLHKCGAALLNEYWAISAAHCVHNVSPNDIMLRLGEYDLKSEREQLPHVERRIQIVATHPRFDASTFEYDLALLRFYEAIPFKDNVLPVCVPDTNDSYVGRNAVVTGWGRLYEDGPLPSVMQKVSVPIITNKECESMYRKAGFIEDIPNIFICAGLAKGGKDSCEGDSGGPLVLKDPNTGQWSLIGIISWGIGCALPNQPGVYTRITHFAEWIRQIIVF